MRRNENGSFFFLHGFFRVDPGEWVGHRGVVVGHEFSELRFEVGYRSEVSTPQKLSMNDTEDDLDLIEPRTVFWKIDETDPMSDVRQERLSRGQDFRIPRSLFFRDRRVRRIDRPPISRGFRTCAYSGSPP
jgi:hypothetical protein